MLTIQERVDKLKPHLIGFRYLEGVYLVDTTLKNGWEILPSTNIEFGNDTKNSNYYMFYSKDNSITIDMLLDYVESIINFNIEKEKKQEFFKIKSDELFELFKKHSLIELQTLNFIISDKPNLSDIELTESEKDMVIKGNKNVDEKETNIKG